MVRECAHEKWRRRKQSETKRNEKKTVHRTIGLNFILTSIYVYVYSTATSTRLHNVYVSSIKHSLNYSWLRFSSSSSNNSFCSKIICILYGNRASTVQTNYFYILYTHAHAHILRTLFQNTENSVPTEWSEHFFLVFIHDVKNSIEGIEGNVFRSQSTNSNIPKRF